MTERKLPYASQHLEVIAVRRPQLKPHTIGCNEMIEGAGSWTAIVAEAMKERGDEFIAQMNAVPDTEPGSE